MDILNLPEIDSEESYELWVTSKTDNQSRSLGEIPKDLTNFDRQLSEAEWRLMAHLFEADSNGETAGHEFPSVFLL